MLYKRLFFIIPPANLSQKFLGAAPTFYLHEFLKSSVIGTARRCHREEGGMKSNARLMDVQMPTELKNEKTAFQKGTVKVGQHTQAIKRHNKQE